jgi:hypothetical protein
MIEPDGGGRFGNACGNSGRISHIGNSVSVSRFRCDGGIGNNRARRIRNGADISGGGISAIGDYSFFNRFCGNSRIDDSSMNRISRNGRLNCGGASWISDRNSRYNKYSGNYNN